MVPLASYLLKLIIVKGLNMTIRVRNMKTYQKLQGDIPVRIDRKTLFGNPYRAQGKGTTEEHAGRSVAIHNYLIYARKEYAKNPVFRKKLQAIANLHYSGMDVVLLCWCYPKYCHAHVLRYIALKLADEIDK